MKKVAIVGLGKWGKNLVREFSKISDIVVCNSTGNSANVKWLAKNYPKIQYTKNFQAILDNKSIDAIIISSPIKTHFTLSQNTLNSGKHVFVEKTISENSRNAKKLIALAKNKNLMIFVGHIFLYHPILKKLKEIHKKESISYLKLNWVKLGSFNEDILLDLVSHYISIIIELLGTPKSIKILNDEKIISSSDIISLEFKFENNVKSIIDINRISNFKKRSILIATKKNIFEWDDDLLYKFNKQKQIFELFFKTKQTPLEIECKEFIKTITKKIDYNNSEQALKIIQLIEKSRGKMK